MMDLSTIIALVFPAVTALGTVTLALYASQAVTARMERARLTMEFLHGYNSDARVDKATRIIRSFRERTEEDIVRACTVGEDREDILFLLNKFELLAICLRHHVYDRDLVMECLRRDICECYDRTGAVIRAIQKEDDEAFVAFQKLAATVMVDEG